MHTAKRNRVKLRTVVLVLVAIAMIFTMGWSYVTDLVMISAKRKELAGAKETLAQQQASNIEMQHVLDGDDAEIQERVARDTYDYAAPNERVFVDMSGK